MSYMNNNENQPKIRKTKIRTHINGINPAEYNYNYFIKNRERLYELRKIKKLCEICNKEYTKETMVGHLKSKKHLLTKELIELKLKLEKED